MWIAVHFGTLTMLKLYFFHLEVVPWGIMGTQHEANDDSCHRQRSHKTIDIIIIVSQHKYAIKITEGIYFFIKACLWCCSQGYYSIKLRLNL